MFFFMLINQLKNILNILIKVFWTVCVNIMTGTSDQLCYFRVYWNYKFKNIYSLNVDNVILWPMYKPSLVSNRLPKSQMKDQSMIYCHKRTKSVFRCLFFQYVWSLATWQNRNNQISPRNQFRHLIINLFIIMILLFK